MNALSEYEMETKKKLSSINSQLRKLDQKSYNLLGENIGDKQRILFEEEFRKQKEKLEKILKDINNIREELRKLKEPPMIWDLAFAEVFQMKQGFDIVIANPPYVRQERIEDLSKFYSKSEYKEKLNRTNEIRLSHMIMME
jgi:hypothetical protein